MRTAIGATGGAADFVREYTLASGGPYWDCGYHKLNRMLAAVFQKRGLTTLAVAPMSIVCQGFSKEKGITVMPGSSWSFHGSPWSSIPTPPL